MVVNEAHSSRNTTDYTQKSNKLVTRISKTQRFTNRSSSTPSLRPQQPRIASIQLHRRRPQAVNGLPISSQLPVSFVGENLPLRTKGGVDSRVGNCIKSRSVIDDSGEREKSVHRHTPQHFLYFFPDPHGHGSFRPTLAALRRGSLRWSLALTRRCALKYRYACNSPAVM
jgi:hypothetical protein